MRRDGNKEGGRKWWEAWRSPMKGQTECPPFLCKSRAKEIPNGRERLFSHRIADFLRKKDENCRTARFPQAGEGRLAGAIQTQGGPISTTPKGWSGAIRSTACAFRQFANRKGNIT